MSLFILAYERRHERAVLESMLRVPGIALISTDPLDCTLRLRTTTRSLDEESEAIHAVEEIRGVIDLRLLEDAESKAAE